MGVDCSNSINYDQVQVLSYSKYSLLLRFLQLGLKLPPSDDFTQKHFPILSTAPCVLAVHCEYNNEDEVNSPNIQTDKIYQASSQKFRQIYIYIYIYEDIVVGTKFKYCF